MAHQPLKLKGTFWRGNGKALGNNRVFNESLELHFLDEYTGCENGYVIIVDWQVFNKRTRRLVASGQDKMVGFMYLDNSIHLSRVEPLEPGYATLRLLPNGNLEYGFNESGYKAHPCAVYAILNQV